MTAGRSATTADPALRRRSRSPRGQGDRLRGEIVAAAAMLLERTGSEESLSLRAIAREVGVSAPSISLHFDQLPQIIDAVVARTLGELYEDLVAAGRSTDDPIERLFRLCRAYVAYGRSNPARYRVLVGRRYLEDWDRDHLSMDDTAPLLAASIQLVSDAIQACIDAGSSTSTDAPFDTLVLWFGLHGLVVVPQSITSLPWPDQDRLLDACVTRAVGLVAPT